MTKRRLKREITRRGSSSAVPELSQPLTFRFFRSMILIIKSWQPCRIVLVLALCAGYAAAQTSASQYGPATLELKRLVAANPEIKRLLLASIEQAKQVNPDPLTNPAQSLDQYYELVA